MYALMAKNEELARAMQPVNELHEQMYPYCGPPNTHYVRVTPQHSVTLLSIYNNLKLIKTLWLQWNVVKIIIKSTKINKELK